MEHHPLSRDLFRQFLRFGHGHQKRKILAQGKAGELALLGLLLHQEKVSGAPAITMSAISQALSVSKPAATQSVERLVAKQFVRREKDPSDRRAVIIHLTEQGRQCFEIHLECALQYADQIITEMGEADATQLLQLLEKFNNCLEHHLQSQKTVCKEETS